ncbi:MAG TPA: ABC transporter ATP-binding protein [Syntrophomonas sp.]|nr:ABC transporter ATP-binding protein [Syntrophomonas sp.]
MPGEIIIKNLDKTFSDHNHQEVQALKGINLKIKPGEFISILGKSGCGKSTLLRIISGLDTDYRGGVWLDSQIVKKPSLEKGLVFQDHRLFPWLTVAENIGYGVPDTQKNKNDLIRDLIGLVGLEGFEDTLPKQLSGGMAQRAAIARALANKPKVLLLDEPFGALDAMTRISMQEEILKIWDKEKITVILVTHDIEEAVYLGDRVVILSSRPGQVKEIQEVKLSRPRNRVSNDFVSEKRKTYYKFFDQVEAKFVYTI